MSADRGVDGRRDDDLVRQAFAELGPAIGKAPAGWQRRVIDRIAGAPAARPKRLSTLLFAGGALAVALAVIFAFRRSADDALVLALAVEPSAHAIPVRGPGARIGDQLRLEVPARGRAPLELRLYRDDALVFSCREDCPREGNRVTARVRIEARGLHRAVAVFAETAVPSTGRFEEDMVALHRARAELDVPPPVPVL